MWPSFGLYSRSDVPSTLPSFLLLRPNRHANTRTDDRNGVLARSERDPTAVHLWLVFRCADFRCAYVCCDGVCCADACWADVCWADVCCTDVCCADICWAAVLVYAVPMSAVLMSAVLMSTVLMFAVLVCAVLMSAVLVHSNGGLRLSPGYLVVCLAFLSAVSPTRTYHPPFHPCHDSAPMDSRTNERTISPWDATSVGLRGPPGLTGHQLMGRSSGFIAAFGGFCAITCCLPHKFKSCHTPIT